MSIEINDDKKVTLSLFLQFKNLTSFPENIDFKNFKNMTAIFLDYNQIEFIPDSIGNLTHLKHISMDSNKLSFLPESIGNLVNLTTLVLNNNRLILLPESYSESYKFTCINFK